jgi:uncharacterized protein YciI
MTAKGTARHWIDGEFVDTGIYQSSINPATGEVIGTFCEATVSIAEAATRASGPLVGTPVRSAMLILTAPTREQALEMIARDPYQIHGLISDMTVTEWDPLFGTYHDESSQTSA